MKFILINLTIIIVNNIDITLKINTEEAELPVISDWMRRDCSDHPCCHLELLACLSWVAFARLPCRDP